MTYCSCSHSDAKLPVERVYVSADCNDKGESKISNYNSASECAGACKAKYSNTKFIGYGKNSRGKQCYCEHSTTCSKRKNHSNFDVYVITG